MTCIARGELVSDSVWLDTSRNPAGLRSGPYWVSLTIDLGSSWECLREWRINYVCNMNIQFGVNTY